MLQYWYIYSIHEKKIQYATLITTQGDFSK